jgi:cytoskeleton protein RodZ
MDYSELGAYLKEERERQELSLDDIQQKTKISVSSLEAIEEGRVNDLPHPVYAKGFIKNYAQCLGLNADELAGTFAQKAGIDEEFEDETEHLQSELTPMKGRSKWPVVSILISIMLLAALGWLVYDLFWAPAELQTNPQREGASQPIEKSKDIEEMSKKQKSEETDLASRNTEEGTQLNQEGGVDPEAEFHEENQTTPAPADDRKKAADAAQETPETEIHGQQQEPESISEQAEDGQGTESTSPEIEQKPVASGSGPAPQSSPGDTKHALQIEANEACWMSASIDAKQRDLYLRPGESVTFRFEQALEIKLGNAGGVKLTFDGQAYPLDADSGEVLSLTFP